MSSGSPPDEMWWDRHYRKRHRRHRSSVFWPVIFIAAGSILLLQNLGLLSWSIWGQLWRLWPLLLIVLGVELVLRDLLRGPIGVLVTLVLIAATVAAAVALSGYFAPVAPSASFASTQMLNGARQVNARINFGAGQLNVGALDGSSDQVSALTYDGPSDLQPQPTYRVSNGVGELSYGPQSKQFQGFPFVRLSGGPSAQIMLTPSVPLTLNVQEGASDAHIDLSKLEVTDLRLQTGASTTWLRLPQATAFTAARIQGGAATVTVEVPDGVAAQIRYRGGLSTINVDTNRFPPAASIEGASTYRSPDYDSAQNKVDLDIETGMATVTVR